MAAPDDDRDIRRVIACLRAVDDRAAPERVPLPFGTVLRNRELPDVWDANVVRVEGQHDDLNAGAVERVCEEELRAFGASRPKVVFEHPATGRRLVAQLREGGWQASRDVVLVQRPPWPPEPEVQVEQVALDDLLHARRAGWRDDPAVGDDPGVLSQLTARVEHVPSSIRRHFAICRDGEPVSFCDLFLAAGAGQVEDVVTLPEHRRRGFGSALVAAAAAAARESGADPVFLIAEADGDARRLYERLGFVVVTEELEAVAPAA
jgi:ribosomal protein S18 acetylase RimI-like enzyme